MSLQNLIDSGNSDEEISTKAFIWNIWFQALTQHYGPGSPYLDVTHSLEVALWFATNSCELVEVDFLFGLDGPLNPVNDILAVERTIHYKSRCDGYLYVFDVLEWDQAGRPKHGDMIDLSRALQAFADSGRVLKQQACLIYADRLIDTGDLRTFLAFEPIQISVAMQDCLFISLPASAVYPSVENDLWYKKLVSLPFVPRISRDSSKFIMQRAIPVNIVAYGSERDGLNEINKHSICIKPIFLGELIPGPTVHIMLETPIWYNTPAVAHNCWNESILVEDLPSNADIVDITGAITGNPVALDDVLFETSPLEIVRWDSTETPGLDRIVLRGFRLDRRSTWKIYIYYQQIGPPENHILTTGPVDVRYDSHMERLEYESKDGWRELRLVEDVAKALYLSLSLIRELSVNIKLRSTPEFFTKDDAQWSYVVGYSPATASLVQLPFVKNSIQYYHIRQIDSLNAYTFGGTPKGFLIVRSKGTFSAISSAELTLAEHYDV